MNYLLLARVLTLFGYFALLSLLLLWFTWLAPSKTAPVTMLLVFIVAPLLIPLRGLLHGKLYTHRWVTFLALFYFTLGVDVAYTNAAERLYGLLEIFFSLCLFFGAVFYVYLTGKHQAESMRTP